MKETVVWEKNDIKSIASYAWSGVHSLLKAYGIPLADIEESGRDLFFVVVGKLKEMNPRTPNIDEIIGVLQSASTLQEKFDLDTDGIIFITPYPYHNKDRVEMQLKDATNIFVLISHGVISASATTETDELNVILDGLKSKIDEYFNNLDAERYLRKTKDTLLEFRTYSRERKDEVSVSASDIFIDILDEIILTSD